MKVMLISIPGSEQAVEPYFPLGIGYLHAVIEKEHDVSSFHYQTDGFAFKHLPKVLSKLKPQIVGITCNTFNRSNVQKAITLIKSFDSKIKVILGGVHPSFMYIQAIDYLKADYVVIGEGEQTIVELLRAIEKNLDLNNIEGIAYQNSGSIGLTKKRKQILDINKLPFPNYSYAKYIMDKSRLGFVITSRGCPVNCVFCSTSSFWGQKTRLYSVKRVVDEMQYLIEKYGVTKIFFHDDTFNISIKRAMDLSNEILKRELKIIWAASLRVNPVSEEMLDIMVESGCRHICWGVESGSEKILKSIEKKINKNQITKAFNLCKKYNKIMSVGAFTLVGCPGETEQTIDQTLNFLNSLTMTDHPSTSILYVLPGTKIYYKVRERYPYLDNFFKKSDECVFDVSENSIETLKKWQELLAQSGDIIEFDKTKHFLSNVTFGKNLEHDMDIRNK